MSGRGWRALALSIALTALADRAAAQETPLDPPAVNPAAIAALEAMGTYLRGIQDFQVAVETLDEDVLDDGQKIQYEGATDLLVHRPSRLRASVSDPRHERLWLYDGAQLTLYGKRVNMYATVPAPPTLVELFQKLEEDHGMSVPLADLFHWGAPEFAPTGIVSALDVGPAQVGGVSCQHYAFRQGQLDWQIWIQKGSYPLPRKLVITDLADEARPQHTSVYTWNLAPSFNDAAFIFDPPSGAERVVLAGNE